MLVWVDKWSKRKNFSSWKVGLMLLHHSQTSRLHHFLLSCAVPHVTKARHLRVLWRIATSQRVLYNNTWPWMTEVGSGDSTRSTNWILLYSFKIYQMNGTNSLKLLEKFSRGEGRVFLNENFVLCIPYGIYPFLSIMSCHIITSSPLTSRNI